MKNRSRPKKPTPERVKPVRDFNGLFGDAKAPTGDSSNGSQAAAPGNGPVGDAYRVIDDYLRQGRRAAENLWTPLGSFAAGPGEPSLLTERFLRGAADLSSAWFDMLQTLSPGESATQHQGKAAPGPFDAGKRKPASAPRKNGATAHGLHVEVAVQSARLAKVEVVVFPGEHAPPLALPMLHSTDEKAPPLKGVELRPLESPTSVLIVLRVPKSQPPGQYHGVLLAGPERRPSGSLTLELLED